MSRKMTLALGALALLGLTVGLLVVLLGRGTEKDAPRAAQRPEEEAANPRLVILYAPCTVNRGYLSPYEPRVAYTPHLDRLAKRSAVFTEHYTEAGQSGTAYASIFSGTQAHHHGVYRHPKELSEELYLIGEAFADAGYETFFFNAHGMASPQLGYGQGIPRHRTYFQRLLIGDDPDFLRVLDRLETDPSYRAFVMANFHVTHGVYKTIDFANFIRRYPQEAEGIDKKSLKQCESFSRSEECNRLLQENSISLRFDYPDAEKRLTKPVVRELAALEELIYKSNVSRLDSLFGTVIGELGLRDLLQQSLVAFTADHGEVLGREDALFKWGHGPGMDPEVLRVPWIVYGPGLGIEPGRYGSVSRSIDVFPTLAGLAGLEPLREKGVEGTDLSPAVLGSEEPPQQLAFSHSTIVGPRTEGERRYDGTLLGKFYPRADVSLMWASISSKEATYKLRSYGGNRWGVEVYDKNRDPFETRDIFDQDDPRHRDMVRRLRAYKKLLVESYRSGAEEETLDEEELDLLRSLGYVG